MGSQDFLGRVVMRGPQLVGPIANDLSGNPFARRAALAAVRALPWLFAGALAAYGVYRLYDWWAKTWVRGSGGWSCSPTPSCGVFWSHPGGASGLYPTTIQGSCPCGQFITPSTSYQSPAWDIYPYIVEYNAKHNHTFPNVVDAVGGYPNPNLGGGTQPLGLVTMPHPYQAPLWWPYPFSPGNPWSPPEAMPVAAPDPYSPPVWSPDVPRPSPRRRPRRRPNPEPGAPPEADPFVDPFRGPTRFPAPAPSPVPSPIGLPGTVFEPGAAPSPASPPRARPPGEGEKERKVKFASQAWYQAWSAVVDLITETEDFTYAVYSALSRAQKRVYRCGPHDAVCHINALYREWDDLPENFFLQALLNVAANQLEDALIGQMNRALARGLGADESWANYILYKALQKSLRQWGPQLSIEAPQIGS